MNRPMNERPTKSGNIVLPHENENFVQIAECSVDESVRLYFPGDDEPRSWEYADDGTYKGWHYLNETVKGEWNVFDDQEGSHVIVGGFTLETYNALDDGATKWSWTAGIPNIGTLTNMLPSGKWYDSIEEAQTTAIKWYNDNIAFKPEVKA